jgi:hypothetical protein
MKYGSFKYGQYKYGLGTQYNSTAAVLVSAEASGTTIRLGAGVSGTIITPISLVRKLAIGWGMPLFYLHPYGQWIKYSSGEGSEIVIINPEAFGKRIIGEVIATMQIIGRDVSLSTRPVGADIIVLQPGRGQIKVTNT